MCKPELLKVEAGKSKCTKLPISDKTISLIREGMKQACSTGGTGWPLFDFYIRSDPAKQEPQGQTLKRIQIACKTGTAESHAKSGMPHAWITAFAPFDNPEISVTVLIEEGGQGSDIAGPIARDILKAYFERSQ